MLGSDSAYWKWRSFEMRVLVTGRNGQVATALIERARTTPGLEIVPVGRPALDLSAPGDLSPLLAPYKPDVIVNAAAYTAVDDAERERYVAMAVNGKGAGAVAFAAKALGVPVIQMSTDFVFDGSRPEPYVETDSVRPLNAYGRSKLAGEEAVAAGQPDHIILRTAWVFAPWGKNFVRTMLRLAGALPEISVVADQRGCPSYAPDIADAILAVARNLIEDPRAELRGVFHMSGAGETDWASFADEIFALARARGGPAALVKRISTADFPTPARRPANSRLNCGKLKAVHGVALPDWRDALSRCIDRLIIDGKVAS